MKAGRDVVVFWSSTQRVFSCLDKWCRRLSSLRGAPEQRKSAAGLGCLFPLEPSAREKFLATPSLWWDSRTNQRTKTRHNLNHLDYKPRRTGDSSGSLGRVGDSEAEDCSKLGEEGQLSDAFRVLDLLVQQGSFVSQSLCYGLLKRCIAEKNLVLGQRLHAITGKIGYGSNTFLADHIIRMYASHGRLEEARQVFTKLTRPTAFTWCSIISAHTEQGCPTQALQLYKQMCRSTVKPDSYTFVAVLKACSSLTDLEFGKQVHTDLLGGEFESDLFIGNSLVDMYAKCGRLDDAFRVFQNLRSKDVVTGNSMITGYAKCGRLDDARKLFDTLPTKNVVTWTAMITGYAQQGMGQEALTLYARMQQDGITSANNVTFMSLLQACSNLRDLPKGRELHSQILEQGLATDVAVGTCLVNMYAKCGRLESARNVFDNLPIRNVVTWNAMITGYVMHGLDEEALSLYKLMQQGAKTPANHFTFSCLLKSCASTRALHIGKQLHMQIRERGLEAHVVVGNCLVDMYAKCGSLQDAQQVFDGLPERDVVTWTALIAGYVQHGLGQEALTLYNRMQHEGISPGNHVTFICLLQACGSVGALCQGKQLHARICGRGLETDPTVGSCLVDMYAKCGRLEDAHNVFVKVPTKGVVTWNSLLNGYAQHCDTQKVIQTFDEMLQQGVEPDCVTFNCLLVACSYDGLVNEGRRFFEMMVDQGITPDAHHLTCMVDLFGRAGRLDEAENLLQTILFETDTVGWTALLSACKIHGDVERGKRCFDRIIKMEPQNAAAYVLLGNMYANAGRWVDVERLEKLRKSTGAWKKPASAFIEVNSRVEMFTVGEERGDIRSKLRSVNLQLKERGHVPHTNLVLKPMSQQEKEDALCGHAEKLALAFGLLNTPDGTPLIVTKNLRMCADCHSGTKVLSLLEKREIVVRDTHRIHRFLDGVCSCGDRT